MDLILNLAIDNQQSISFGHWSSKEGSNVIADAKTSRHFAIQLWGKTSKAIL